MLCQQLVFVGGAVAGLLITDPAQPAVRPTEDVDLLAQVVARTDYYQLEQALRARGFAQDLRPDDPICRWIIDRVLNLTKLRKSGKKFAMQHNELAARLGAAM